MLWRLYLLDKNVLSGTFMQSQDLYILDAGQGGDGRLGEVTLFLKTDPRLEVNPGDRICIRQPWQAMDVDGIRLLLIRNAFVINIGGFS